MRVFGLSVLLLLSPALPGFAQEARLTPEQRVEIRNGVDLPGGDLAQIFDTTFDACRAACLTNSQCTAFTFNTRSNSCFPKSAPGPDTPFANAVSGLVLPADPSVEPRAKAAREELAFLQNFDLTRAHDDATELGRVHPSNGLRAEELLAASAEAQARAAWGEAARLTGAATNLTDAASDWAEYAALLLQAANADPNNEQAWLDRAHVAAINAYLRAAGAAERHNILLTMAEAQERLGRGRDMVQALRLAQSLQARDDTALMLEVAAGKYGFRILETDVQSDGPRPRICANFSEDLSKSGVEYEDFVQLPEAGLTVTREGDRNLCVEGLSHGARYALTFRAGLPAADGQSLLKPVAITSYVRDRAAQVRFPGRAYVLPKGEGAAVPVVTVNAPELELALFRVTDRNLTRAFQNGYFSAPIANWQEADFATGTGLRVWTGSATVGGEVNRDTTTRLPLAEALAGQPAGTYALKVAVAGADPYETPAAWQWFTLSDLGMTTLSGVDGLHVFVRSLGTAEAKVGVTVELISVGNEVLGTAQTDAMGYARFDAGLSRGTGAAAPALVIAREGEADLAFLSLTEPEFDLSDRGVEGREAAPPVDLFLTTDRGAYRAGETVYATALARDSRAEAVVGLPLTAVLKRPDGVEYSRNQVADWDGGYVFSLPIAGTAPRGVWRIEMLADLEAPPLATRTFLVEDFLPERIGVELSLPDSPLRAGEVAELGVDAQYLFGAPASGLAIEGEVLVRAASELAGFTGYRFGLHDEPFSARMESFGDLRTGEDGLATVFAPLPVIDAADRPLEARFTLRVAEGSGRPVERQITRGLAPDAPLIGVRPLFDGVVAEGGEGRFALIGLGATGQPEAMPARWVLSRIETRYQWYQAYGNWNWEPVTTREVVAEGEVQLGTAPVEIAAPVTWGQFELRVDRSDGVYAATSTLFDAGWYAPADVSSTPDMLELSLDAPAYKPGDTATLRLVPRAAGTALVTVLSNRLVAMQAVEVTEGENLIPLLVTDDWGAGVYITASVLRPMDEAAGRLPGRALGLAHAAIDPGKRQLSASVEAPAEAAPRGPLPIAVKVAGAAEGEVVHATIAAVDQGILNLTAFTPPDPSAHYFGQRKLGVGIRDIYGRLIDGMNGAEGQVRSGGDAGVQARLQAPPPTEELVAFFTGPVTVGADGYARTSFDLPAFNGAVRVMAVVWSRTGVGQAHADVLVRDPVVVSASLPRFLSPGDESRLLLEITHATGPAGRMGLDVAGQGVVLGQVPSGLDLAAGGTAVLAVPLRAEAAGLHQVQVTLTTPDGKVLPKTLTLPVQSGDPMVTRTTRLTLARGQTLQLDAEAFAGFASEGAFATIALGPMARINAPGLLAALDAYPYGCTEQITSQALPLLYLSQMAQTMDLPGAANVELRISQSIAEILTKQGAEGSFGLWSAGSGDLWLDAYVTDFLSRAQAQGFAVPDRAFRQALDNLRNQVNFAADFDANSNDGGEGLAYALMVLAREGAAAIGDLRYYADVKGDDFRTPLAQAQLGAALASYGDPTRADAMFRRAMARLDGTPATEAQIWRADYGTVYRDRAAILTLAAEAGSAVVDPEALASQLATPADRLSTQEAAWALMAANALIGTPGTEGLRVNGQPATSPVLRMAGPDHPIELRNDGADTQITLTTFGVPLVAEPAAGNGYAISRSYYRLDGTPASLEGVRMGDRLVTVLEVTPFTDSQARLMVADPLPAGLEIDNPNLLSGGAVADLDWLNLTSDVAHSEFRQDRFLTAIDHSGGQPFRLAYVVRAISPGSFHHPAPSVEDMYQPMFRAQGEAGRVVIGE